MADVNVRKAVQAAINRDLINQNFYNGEGTLLNGVLPPAIPGYSEDQTPIKYDVEEAKKLLKEAGHESRCDTYNSSEWRKVHIHILLMK